MTRHRSVGSGPLDGGPATTPRDPRHRPVVLYVAPRRSRLGRRPATLSAAVGTSVLLISLMTVTLVSAWAGWQVAARGPADGLITAPAVPRSPAADADVGGSRDLPAPGADPATAGAWGQWWTMRREAARAQRAAIAVPPVARHSSGATEEAAAAGMPATGAAREVPAPDDPPSSASTQTPLATPAAAPSPADAAPGTSPAPPSAPGTTPPADTPAAATTPPTPSSTPPTPSSTPRDTCPTPAAPGDPTHESAPVPLPGRLGNDHVESTPDPSRAGATAPDDHPGDQEDGGAADGGSVPYQ